MFSNNLLILVTVKDAAVSSLMTTDICTSSSATLSCANSLYTTYGPFLTEALYGVKLDGSTSCVYRYLFRNGIIL